MFRKVLFFLVGIALIPSLAWSFEIYRNDDTVLNVGYWGQAWYQHVSDYDLDRDGESDGSLNEFMLRRSYFSVGGTVTQNLNFFVHYAADRIGQEGLDNSGVAVGSGLAVRDAYANYKILGNDLMIQAGRMYVPFTRDYGTTSTKALLTGDLNWGQGGIRSNIFYPSKVGRDDGVTVWGNVLQDKLQYRFMVGEGVKGATSIDPDLPEMPLGAVENPDDNFRYAGRISYSFLDPETGWFNLGTNLGAASILAIGAGFDYQSDLNWGDTQGNYSAYTIDLHLDMPLGPGAITGDIAYININNSANGITDTDLSAGSDGEIISTQLGYLFIDRIQPFAHFQAILPDGDGTEDTLIYGLGVNYYIRGLANKITVDWTTVNSDSDNITDKDIITVQLAFGF